MAGTAGDGRRPRAAARPAPLRLSRFIDASRRAAGPHEVRGHTWQTRDPADRADLDVPLYQAVSAWLAEAWPFTVVRYAAR